MCSDNIESIPVLLGKNHSLFGVRMGPSDPITDVGIIILNAGLLHNVGPFRLHVDIASRLAGIGYISLRLDQSGKGESPRRPGQSRVESILVDYDDTVEHFREIGITSTILVGLCSGADDALLIASERDSIAGLILLDGYACKNTQYHIRHYANRIFKIGPWIRAIRRLTQPRSFLPDINFRDWEEDSAMLQKLARLLDGGGNILSVFTAGQNYYNHLGQLRSELPETCKRDNLEEIYFDQVDHTYNVTYHRLQLLDKIERWVTEHYPARDDVSRDGDRGKTT